MRWGHIDAVRPGGLVDGWCWDDELPDEAIDVTILVDGTPSGRALAGLYREDLRASKIGDGFHAFTLALQDYDPSSRRAQTLTLVQTGSETPIGHPFLLRQEIAQSLDDRLIELEARNRLLETKVNELKQHAIYGSAPAELFATVGAFFTRLASDAARGVPLGADARLEDIIQSTIDAYAGFLLTPPQKPLFTILVQADCSLGQLYKCLLALERAGANDMANIIVLDHGSYEDVVLITTVVRGVRYIRLEGDLTSEWIEAEISDRAEIMLLLTGRAVVTSSFLQSLAFRFEFDLGAAAVGCYVIDMQDNPVNSGLLLSDGEIYCELDGGASAAQDLVHPVHALTQHVAAFRRDALRSVGGIDRSFRDDLGHAVIDLCFRLRSCGWSILVDPDVCVNWHPPTDGRGWAPEKSDLARGRRTIEQRWFGATNRVPPIFVGKAVILGASIDVAEVIRASGFLRKAGYDVTYIQNKDDLSPTFLQQCRKGGARVVPGDKLDGLSVDFFFAFTIDDADLYETRDESVVIGLDALVRRLDGHEAPPS